jgi:hypothetical protein
MKLRVAGCLAFLSALAALHCGGEEVPLGGGNPDGGTSSSSSSGSPGSDGGYAPEGPPGFEDPGIPTVSTSSKVDILLAIDNSQSMKAKATVLANSLGTFLTTLAGRTSDIHLGVITSSLGNFGGDVCPAQNPNADMRAHLIASQDAPDGVLRVTRPEDVPTFISNATEIVRNVSQDGCGLEAQLESMYRFLVQPDPWDVVKRDAFLQADLGVGFDTTVLAQRAAFLRPDSLVIVLMLTDEDDSSPDPLAINGFGYAFSSREFPGSKVRRGAQAQGTTAPRGTSICQTDPGSEDCSSCGFQMNCDPNTTACQKIKQDPNCTKSGDPGSQGEGFNGFYAAAEDDLNIRYHHMKERYGIDPQYPIDRYVAGFGASSVPDRDGEHVVTTGATGQRMIANYTFGRRCTNPLFASKLPSQPGDELCALPRGPRTPELVVFGILGGAPNQLTEVANPDWTKLLGADPEHYNYAGIDAHMIQSSTPRAGLTGGDPNSPRGQNGTDPVNGREWNTQKRDLQYACTFDLPDPVSCVGNPESCDCADDPSQPGKPSTNTPLCAKDGSAAQIKGKAYPSVRELLVAKKMGSRATIGSICPAPGKTTYDTFTARLAANVLPRLK